MTGPAAQPLVYCIVLTWNNFDDTDECLESLGRLTYPNRRVILVDNGSTDGSKERLKERWPGVTFIENATNLGVAAGFNAGACPALAAGADYVLFLNNDLTVAPDLIERLLPAYALEGTATVSPVITFFDHPGVVWYAGGVHSRTFGFTRQRFLGDALSSLRLQPGRFSETEMVPTCAALVSRHALETVGLLDERFFLTNDDVDWCLRARAKGLKPRLLEEALVRHKVSVDSGNRGSTTMSEGLAFNHARYGVLCSFVHARGIRLATQLFGHVFIQLPYFSVRMLRAGRWRGPLSYLRGLATGFGDALQTTREPRRERRVLEEER
jgi:GT2 family glycosyltransferase